MRRSFGSGGMGGGSGGGCGGGMLRAVQRAVGAGVGGGPPEPFSSSGNTTTTRANSRRDNHFNKKQPTSPKTALAFSANNSNNNASSPFSSLINLPLSATSGAAAPSWGGSSSSCSDDSEWGWVDGGEDERGRVFYEDIVFGTVPSGDEVHHAVSALQQVLGPSSNIRFPKEKLAEDRDKEVADEVSNPTGLEKRFSSSESEMDWVEPSLDPYNAGMLQPRGSHRVYDAFHLLQTEPSVLRMVISLSSDKAVWDAVMNNEVVRELRGSISQADNLVGDSPGKDSDDSNPVKDILSWIAMNAKAKIIQLIDSITKLVNEVFQLPNEEEKGGDVKDHPFEEKLKTSLLLSVVVLLIVVITRTQSA